MQLGQLLFRGFQPRGDVDELAGQRVQPVARVDHQVAQLVEGPVCVSSSRLARAAPTITRVSRSRRSAGGPRHLVVELLSHRLKACARMTLAASTALANGSVCA